MREEQRCALLSLLLLLLLMMMMMMMNNHDRNAPVKVIALPFRFAVRCTCCCWAIRALASRKS